jgi:hypothetical protein
MYAIVTLSAKRSQAGRITPKSITFTFTGRHDSNCASKRKHYLYIQKCKEISGRIE